MQLSDARSYGAGYGYERRRPRGYDPSPLVRVLMHHIMTTHDRYFPRHTAAVDTTSTVSSSSSPPVAHSVTRKHLPISAVHLQSVIQNAVILARNEAGTWALRLLAEYNVDFDQFLPTVPYHIIISYACVEICLINTRVLARYI